MRSSLNLHAIVAAAIKSRRDDVRPIYGGCRARPVALASDCPKRGGARRRAQWPALQWGASDGPQSPIFGRINSYPLMRGGLRRLDQGRAERGISFRVLPVLRLPAPWLFPGQECGPGCQMMVRRKGSRSVPTSANHPVVPAWQSASQVSPGTDASVVRSPWTRRTSGARNVGDRENLSRTSNFHLRPP